MLACTYQSPASHLFSSSPVGGGGADLLQAMRALSRSLRPALFIKPSPAAPSAPGPVGDGAAPRSAAADVEAVAVPDSTISSSGSDMDSSSSSYQHVATEIPLAVAMPVRLGVGTTTTTTTVTAAELAAGDPAEHRSRRLPAVVVMVACGLVTLCGILRLVCLRPLVTPDPLPPPPTVP